MCPVSLDSLVKLVKKVLLDLLDHRENLDKLVRLDYPDSRVKEVFQDYR